MKRVNKNNFDINKFMNNKIAIHCNTREKANDFSKFLDSFGITWSSKTSPIEHNYWEVYKEDTCYTVYNILYYCNVDYYRDKGCKIYEWEIINENKVLGTKFKHGKVYKDNIGIKYKLNENGIIMFYNKSRGKWVESIETYNFFARNTFEEVSKKEIDWNKIPRGTKVQVRDDEYGEWVNRYFVKYDNKRDFKFLVSYIGKYDDFIGDDIENCEYNWNECKLHPSVEIKEEWYK